VSYADIEAELARHPRVAECAVVRIPVGSGKPALVAYVVADGPVDIVELRVFLADSRLPTGRIPQAVIPVDALPRTASGEVDRAGLPLPVVAGRAAGGKSSYRPDTGPHRQFVAQMATITILVAIVAGALTPGLWPGSTDLSTVPRPWATLFVGLYVVEWLSFGLGIAFLFRGYQHIGGRGGSAALSRAAHLAIVWLLVAWWPQDNAYRVTARNDWPAQAALVYGFNVTLMIAAVVLVCYVVSIRRPR
jgi:AMP-binding enzyme C-terminal domain